MAVVRTEVGREEEDKVESGVSLGMFVIEWRDGGSTAGAGIVGSRCLRAVDDGFRDLMLLLMAEYDVLHNHVSLRRICCSCSR